MYVSKDDLNHYLVHSSAFNGLRSAKNVVFFPFCILVDMPMGGGGEGYSPPPSLWRGKRKLQSGTQVPPKILVFPQTNLTSTPEL